MAHPGFVNSTPHNARANNREAYGGEIYLVQGHDAGSAECVAARSEISKMREDK